MTAFQVWVGWGLSPGEFWSSHPSIFWWVAKQKKRDADNRPGKYLSMSETEVRQIYEETYGD